MLVSNNVNSNIQLQEIKEELNRYLKTENNNPWWKQELPLGIMQKKYLHKGESTVAEFIWRVSKIFTPALGRKVAQLMIKGSFFPGGRSLYGAGSKNKFDATMSNCYIMPCPKDSLDSIYESNREIAKIFKSGGGIGINLSTLRPNGAKTNNAARTSTGAVSFMHLYNTTGTVIGFHGRRGATLIGLDISHPDIYEFVDLRSKYDMKAMNISCIITDDFMKAVESGSSYELHFEVPETGEKFCKFISARKLYHKICEMNWDWGDPGMLFKTRVDKYNLQQYNKDFKINICNPCAEYTGPDYNSCNLGSLNLYNYIKNPFGPNPNFSAKDFVKDVKIAVEALDEILDYGYAMQPLEQNKEIITKWRSIGLGFFGFADALIALKIRYGSPESINFAKLVCNIMTSAAINKSSILGQQKGSFEEFHLQSILKSDLVKELQTTAYGNNAIQSLKDRKALRNAQLISIAPTGSLSLLAGMCSSGLEPIFKCVYERSTHGLEDQNISFQVADRAISDLLAYHNIPQGSLSSEEIKKKFPWVVEAADIDPLSRINVQAAMQSQIDNAISSTINLPESATVEDIEEIYMYAYKHGLKGVTVFRDNCKRASILNFGTCKKEKPNEEKKSEEPEIKIEIPKEENKEESIMNTIDPISRKDKGPLEGRTYRKRTACVKALYVTVNRDENGNIFEVFTNKSVHGCSANIATITRMTSLALRSGVKVDTVIKELKENACQACQKLIKEHPEYNCSLSCPYAIGEAIEEEVKYVNKKTITADQLTEIVSEAKDYIEDKLQPEPDKKIDPVSILSNMKPTVIDENKAPGIFYPINHKEYNDSKSLFLKCPECHQPTLIIEGKCMTCKSCGYSKCD